MKTTEIILIGLAGLAAWALLSHASTVAAQATPGATTTPTSTTNSGTVDDTSAAASDLYAWLFGGDNNYVSTNSTTVAGSSSATGDISGSGLTPSTTPAATNDKLPTRTYSTIGTKPTAS